MQRLRGLAGFPNGAPLLGQAQPERFGKSELARACQQRQTERVATRCQLLAAGAEPGSVECEQVFQLLGRDSLQCAEKLHGRALSAAM